MQQVADNRPVLCGYSLGHNWITVLESPFSCANWIKRTHLSEALPCTVWAERGTMHVGGSE